MSKDGRRFIGLVCALVGTLGLVAAGCSKGSPGRAARAPTSSPAASTQSQPAASGSGGPGTSASVNSGSGQHGSAAAPSKSGKSGSAPVSGLAPAGGGNSLTPPAAGTYSYRQSGNASINGDSRSAPPEAVTVVDAPVAHGSGSWTQVWHEYQSTDTSQPADDSTFQFSPSGISVISEVLRQEGVSVSCNFSPPVQVVDWPVKVGYTFSGAGSCGSFSISIKGGITRTLQATVGGSTVTAYVLDFTATTQGQFNSTSTIEEWLDPALRLDIHEATNTNGTYGAFKFQGNLTRDLVSTNPT